MASKWSRVYHWCNGRVKRHGLGLTVLLFCFLCLEMWRNHPTNIPTHFKVHLKRDQQRQCQSSEGCNFDITTAISNKARERKADEDKDSEDLYMKQRRDAISRACASFPPQAISHNMQHALADREHMFLYCPVEKSASTFWRRFMYQLVLTHPMQSPFDVSVQTVYSGRFPGDKVKVTETGDALDKMLRSFTRMLFIREPYSRLLSAYVDKLLAPNPVLWSMWGLPSTALCEDPSTRLWCKDRSSYLKHAQRTFPAGEVDQPKIRESSGTVQNKSCGEDVTFPEFIKLATLILAKTNPHVMPIYRMCSPCYANYTIIGHMDTFDRDVRLLLPKINITESQMNLDKINDNVAYDAIEDSVHDSMSKAWLSRSLSCITKLEVVQRIWRKLQIRGFVSWRLKPSDFELNDQAVLHMDGPTLIKVLVSANLKSSNKTELKLQKKQALKEAYSLLQPDQFEEVWEIFGPDFKIFGFEQRPKAFDDFRRVDFVNTGALDLTRDWNMEHVL